MGADRGTKLLTYLADVTVNQPHGPATTLIKPAHQAARPRPRRPGAPGRRATCSCGSARPSSPGSCAQRTDVPVTDTTFRDAHQTLLATRVRTRDLLHVAGHVSRLDPRAALDGGLGRRHLRRRAALPRRGPVGAARRCCARRCRTSRCRCCCAGATPSATRPYPTKVTDAFVARGRPHRARHLPDLRLAQRRRADAPGRRGGARHRHRGRRGGPVLHRQPARPARDALHARLLPAPRRADRRDRRARARHQGHGRAAARAGGHDASSRRCASASTCRCTCTPTTRPAARSAPCSPPSTPGSTRSTPRRPTMAGTTSQPSLSALVAATDDTDRADRPRHRRGLRASSRTGRPSARSTAPFESRAGLPHGPGLLPRDPRRAAVQPAPAGDRPRPRRPVRGHRGHVRRGRTGSSATWSRSPRPPRSSATSRCTSSAAGADPDGLRGRTRRRYDIPDSVIGFLDGELGDPPGGWPEPFRTKALQGRHAKPRGHRAAPRSRRPRSRADAAPHAQPAALPRPDQGVRGQPRALRRPLGARHASSSCTGSSQGSEYEVEIEAGQAPADRRRRRSARPTGQGHAHRHVHPQRPVPAHPGARPVGRGRRQGRGEGRPGEPGPGRRAVRRRRHPVGRRGRHRRGRRRRSRPSRR